MFKEHLAKWLDKRQPFEAPPRQIVLSDELTERIELSAAAQSEERTAQQKLSNAAKILRLQALEAARTGRFTDAETLFASSLATYQDVETLNSYGLLLDSLGELDRARQLFERLVEAASSAGNKNLLATAYANLGHIWAKRSNIKTASKYWTLASEVAGIVLIGEPQRYVEFYSCFISYSTKDQDFADRLYADLQASGVRCWFAPEDLKIGEKLRPSFDEAIRVHEKLLVLLSESSVRSLWVEREVETALERERGQNRIVLVPIRLDDAVMETEQAWAADIRRTRHIGDFRKWKDHDSYKKAFDRLLRDLKAEDKRRQQ